MKVLVASTGVPFRHSSADTAADHLVRRVSDAGYDVERLRIPVTLRPKQLATQFSMLRLIELEGADRLIALDIPAALLRTAEPKILCLPASGSPSEVLGSAHLTPSQRHTSLNAVRMALGESSAVFACSRLQSLELAADFGTSTVLVDLGPESRRTSGAGGGPITVVGPIDGLHHHLEFVTALAYAHRDVRLTITGAVMNDTAAARIGDRIVRLGLTERIRFAPGETNVRHMEGVLSDTSAVLCGSPDEDSGVSIALEAMTRGIPVVTTAGSALRYRADIHHVRSDARSIAPFLTSASRQRPSGYPSARAETRVSGTAGIPFDRAVLDAVR